MRGREIGRFDIAQVENVALYAQERLNEALGDFSDSRAPNEEILDADARVDREIVSP